MDKRKATSGARDMAVVALVSGKTHADAAQDAGVSRSTLSEWLKQPSFQIRLADARRVVLRRSSDQAASAAARSYEVLEVLLESTEDDGLKAHIATKMIDLGLKYRAQVSLEDQISELRSELDMLKSMHRPDGEAEDGDDGPDQGV
jgi:transposase-like protein